MDDEFFDAEATRKVAHRALLSALSAFIGGGAAAIFPLASSVMIVVHVIVLVVAVSAIRTLNHPEARVIGAIRHAGIVLAAVGGLAAIMGIALRVLFVFRSS
jgi:hypothetical protein